ncbi:helix-turn-helix transcriptional regulator [Gracilimonas sediminicola]|uniref:Helix-turn-helix transcriptional regulator n=1 Tax=Gracilimonas sediminicola TaxID=2952158 RepID=A0A9X2L1P5_9BACT|nr:helix-turn-helix transcriptional regulator [Gracilimonas sediminicola]MCP9290589.1 helix-turn-helix transcriptional regulator [Gracilimonas sediminicola]
MDYVEYSAPVSVSHLVESYWVSTLHPDDFEQDFDFIIPDGSTDVIFMLNGNYLRDDEENNEKHLVEYCSLVPAFRKAVKVYQKPFTKCLGMRFKPGAIQQLTGISLQELSEVGYPLQQLMPELADLAMDEALKKTPAPKIIDQINSWLVTQVKEPRQDHVISAFIAEVIKRQGGVTISAFCESFGMHKSTLEKNFKHATGLSPKQYANLIRFNYLLNQLIFSGASLTETGYDLGYFDQSHMIKDFKKVIGITPKEFLDKNFTVPKLAALSISNKRAHFRSAQI